MADLKHGWVREVLFPVPGRAAPLHADPASRLFQDRIRDAGRLPVPGVALRAPAGSRELVGEMLDAMMPAPAAGGRRAWRSPAWKQLRPLLQQLPASRTKDEAQLLLHNAAYRGLDEACSRFVLAALSRFDPRVWQEFRRCMAELDREVARFAGRR